MTSLIRPGNLHGKEPANRLWGLLYWRLPRSISSSVASSMASRRSPRCFCSLPSTWLATPVTCCFELPTSYPASSWILPPISFALPFTWSLFMMRSSLKKCDEQMIRTGIETHCTQANRTNLYARLKPAMVAVREASLPDGNSV